MKPIPTLFIENAVGIGDHRGNKTREEDSMNEKQRRPLRVATVYSSAASGIYLGQVFSSQRDAARALGCSQPAVSSAMKNRNFCRGVWLEVVPQLPMPGRKWPFAASAPENHVLMPLARADAPGATVEDMEPTP